MNKNKLKKISIIFLSFGILSTPIKLDKSELITKYKKVIVSSEDYLENQINNKKISADIENENKVVMEINKPEKMLEVKEVEKNSIKNYPEIKEKLKKFSANNKLNMIVINENNNNSQYLMELLFLGINSREDIIKILTENNINKLATFYKNDNQSFKYDIYAITYQNNAFFLIDDELLNETIVITNYDKQLSNNIEIGQIFEGIENCFNLLSFELEFNNSFEKQKTR